MSDLSQEKKFKYAANAAYALAAGYAGYKFLWPKEIDFDSLHSKAVENCKHKLDVPWYGQFMGQKDAKQKAMTAFEKCVGNRVEEKILYERSHSASVDIGVTVAALGIAIVFSTISDMYRKHRTQRAIAAPNKSEGPEPV